MLTTEPKSTEYGTLIPIAYTDSRGHDVIGFKWGEGTFERIIVSKIATSDEPYHRAYYKAVRRAYDRA